MNNEHRTLNSEDWRLQGFLTSSFYNTVCAPRNRKS